MILKRRLDLVAFAALFFFGLPSRGLAQIARSHPSDLPRAEVSMYAGGWSFDPSGWSGVGARATFNRSEWLATEVSVDHRRHDQYGGAEGLVLVSVRALDPSRDRPARGFFEAGGAVGAGLERVLLPMVGFGIETVPDRGVSTRGEFQYFAGGPAHQRRNARVLLGIVIKIR
jgi:hypothetical protein